MGEICEGKEGPFPLPHPSSLASATSIRSSLETQSPNLTCCPLTPTRLTSSCVSSKGLAHVMSGLSHCYHLEELE